MDAEWIFHSPSGLAETCCFTHMLVSTHDESVAAEELHPRCWPPRSPPLSGLHTTAWQHVLSMLMRHVCGKNWKCFLLNCHLGVGLRILTDRRKQVCVLYALWWSHVYFLSMCELLTQDVLRYPGECLNLFLMLLREHRIQKQICMIGSYDRSRRRPASLKSLKCSCSRLDEAPGLSAPELHVSRVAG